MAPTLVGVDDLSAQISEWRDNDEAAAAAASRSRRHWLAQQAAESTTMSGVLLTLAERRALVTVRTAAGRQRGVITSVTTALGTVDLGSGRHALVPVGAITAVESDGPGISDDRVPSATTSLATVLAALVAERPPLTLHLADGTTVGGQLTKVGADVVSVSGLTVTHVPLAAIAVCVL